MKMATLPEDIRSGEMISKIYEVFTKSYKDETDYLLMTQGMVNDFKLKTKSESVECKVDRLKEMKSDDTNNKHTI